MKNILGIVAEYNPLHNGHIYHIEEAKKHTNADYVVVVISGNFTQRGETSIVSKWEKAKMALCAGVDMVIELPTIYSVASAETFAEGAVKILMQIGAKYISFGMEATNIKDVSEIADILYKEPEEYVHILKQELKKGISYPQARQQAILQYTKNTEYEKIIIEPNNILAIEYIKAIKRNKANIIPVGIQRKDSSHKSTEIENKLASSTAIRNILAQGEIEKVKNLLPKSSYEILIQNIEHRNYVKNLKQFEKIIIYKLRCMKTSEIANLPDVNEGLEYLISRASRETNSLDELMKKIKTKRYTYTKIQRILIYALLGITKQDMNLARSIIPYIRILGLSEKGKELVSRTAENTTLITSVKDFENRNTNNDYERLIKIDILATDIYTIAFEQNSTANLDYTTRIVSS